MELRQREVDVLYERCKENALQSPDHRKKVSACSFRKYNDGRFIVEYICFNSRPCEDKNFTQCVGEDGKSHPALIHAEEKVLLKPYPDVGNNCDRFMFSTSCPCIRCAARIYESGEIKAVYFVEDHDDNIGKDYLEELGIPCIKVYPSNKEE